MVLFSPIVTPIIVARQTLLTAQQLKRLGRDRERKTERWSNFQHRIDSAPDSPERGFELALYYAVTHDDQAGRRGRPLGRGSSSRGTAGCACSRLVC